MENCTDKEGVYIGCDTSGKPLHFKPFSKKINENSFCMGTPGHGMSFAVTMEMIKALKEGNNCIVFDPKSEYSKMINDGNENK